MNTITENLQVTMTLLPAVRLNPKDATSVMVEYAVVRSSRFCVPTLAEKAETVMREVEEAEKSVELLFSSGLFTEDTMSFVSVPTAADKKLQSRVSEVFNDGVLSTNYHLVVTDKISGGYPNHKLFISISVSPFVIHANNFSKKNPFWNPGTVKDSNSKLDSFENVKLWVETMKRSGAELFKSLGIEAEYNIAYMLVANQLWKNLNMSRPQFDAEPRDNLSVPFTVLMPGMKRLSLQLLTSGANFLRIDNFFFALFAERRNKTFSLAPGRKEWLESWVFGEKDEEALLCCLVPREVMFEIIKNS